MARGALWLRVIGIALAMVLLAGYRVGGPPPPAAGMAAAGEAAVIAGAATYPERIALPATAMFEAILDDEGAGAEPCVVVTRFIEARSDRRCARAHVDAS